MHVVDPGDVLDADHTFVARLVREPRRADEIADRVDPGLAGAQPFIDDDMGALDLDPVSSRPISSTLPTMPTARMTFSTEISDIVPPASIRAATSAGGALQGLYRGTGVDLYSLLFE